jgi:6-phosphogluconolactonase
VSFKIISVKLNTIIVKSILLVLTCITSMVNAQTASTYNLLVGTYSSEKSKGIHVYSFNTETGEFSQKAEAEVKNPSYLAITKDRKHVYSVSEGSEGTISAFSFNALTGQLTYLNSAPSGGNGPCYVSIDDKNKFVFAGNYGGGSLTAIPIKADGSLSSDIQNIQHVGKSIKPNQDKPHVHAAVLSKDNKYLFVPDLGTDKVNIYSVDVTKPKPLTPANPAFASIAAGGGPRHFTFHPNGKYGYVIHENTGEVTVFDYASGQLKEKQRVSMPVAGYTGNIHAADIHISPDGKFLYGSMRAEINELGIYSIDKKGMLTFVGRQSTLGKIPRNFSIDPSGNFLLVANQNSDEVVIFKRDKKSGLLTDTGKRISVGKPVCLKFVATN